MGPESVPDGRMTAVPVVASQRLDMAENPLHEPVGAPAIDFHTSSPLTQRGPHATGTGPLLRADEPEAPARARQRPQRRGTWRWSIVLSCVVHGAALGAVALWMTARPAPEPELVCLTQCAFFEPDFAEEPQEDFEDTEFLEPVEIEETALPVPELMETPDEVVLPDAEVFPELDARSPALAVTPRMFERPKKVPPAPVVPKIVTTQALRTTEIVPAAQPRKPRPGTKLKALHIPSTARYYPVRARQRGIQGTVIVRLTVDAGGRVIDVRVDTSSGYAVLDEAGVRLMYDARFAPPGTKVTKKAPINFILR